MPKKACTAATTLQRTASNWLMKSCSQAAKRRWREWTEVIVFCMASVPLEMFGIKLKNMHWDTDAIFLQEQSVISRSTGCYQTDCTLLDWLLSPCTECLRLLVSHPKMIRLVFVPFRCAFFIGSSPESVGAIGAYRGVFPPVGCQLQLPNSRTAPPYDFTPATPPQLG